MGSLGDDIPDGALVLALDVSIDSAALEAQLEAAGSGTLLCLGTGTNSAFVELSHDDETGEDLARVFDASLGDPMPITRDAPATAGMLQLETGHGLQEGDQILVDFPADPNTEDGIGARSMLVTVESVGGDFVALSAPLPSDIPAGTLAVRKLLDVRDVTDSRTDDPSLGSTSRMLLESLSEDGTVIEVATGTSVRELQNILDTAPADSVIRLAEGSYSFDETLVINRSDITLEGAGAGKTNIVHDASNAGQPAIRVGPPVDQEVRGAEISLALDAAGGARSLRLETGHGLELGDRIYISRKNTDAVFEEIGGTDQQPEPSLCSFVAEVVDVVGNSIALSESIPVDFDAEDTNVQTIEMLDDVSIFGLTVTSADDETDQSEPSRQPSEGNRSSAITVNATDGFLMQNVELRDPGANGIEIAASIHAFLDDIRVHAPHNTGDGDNGYSICLRDVFNSTFTDLPLEDGRQAIHVGSNGSATDNLVQVAQTNHKVSFHVGPDTGNDFDVNDTTFDTGADRDRADTIPSDGSGPDAQKYNGTDTIGTVAPDAITRREYDPAIVHASGDTGQFDDGTGNDEMAIGEGLCALDMARIEDEFIFSAVGSTARSKNVEAIAFADAFFSETQLQDLVEQSSANALDASV